MPITIETRPKNALTSQEIIKRYPLLTAHLICESLGYFSPNAAAAAIAAHREQRPFPCEWYTHTAGHQEEALLECGRRKIANAFRNRRMHRGYMADIDAAKAAVHEQAADPYRHRFAAW